MIKLGKPPYLDVSLGGDKRFSASYAKVGNNAIRYHLLGSAAEQKLEAHIALWKRYLRDKPLLKAILIGATGIEDGMCRSGTVSHAHALWEIRQELLDDDL